MHAGCSACVPATLAERHFARAPAAGVPSLVHGEITLDGELDHGRLDRALAAVERRHPLLRARRCGSDPEHWRIRAGGAGRIHRTGTRATPADLHAARTGALTRPIDLATDGPLRVHLVRTGSGDGLVAVAHHALVDGVAIVRILADLARAYAGGDLGAVERSWADARHLDTTGMDVAQAAAVAATVRSRTRATPARIAPEPATGAPDTGALVEPLVRSAHARGGDGAGDADRLVEAVAAAVRRWNHAHGAGTGHERIVVSLAVNLRPLQAWSEAVANAGLLWPVAVDAGEARDVRRRIAAQAAEVRLGRRSRAVRGLAASIAGADPRPGGSGAVPVWARRAMAGTTVLSHATRLEGTVDFGDGAPAVTRVWATPPATPSAGIAFGACLDPACAWLSARYLARRLSHEAARHLTRDIADTFAALGRA